MLTAAFLAEIGEANDSFQLKQSCFKQVNLFSFLSFCQLLGECMDGNKHSKTSAFSQVIRSQLQPLALVSHWCSWLLAAGSQTLLFTRASPPQFFPAAWALYPRGCWTLQPRASWSFPHPLLTAKMPLVNIFWWWAAEWSSVCCWIWDPTFLCF